MKIVIENDEDMLKLVAWYSSGEINAELYYDTMDAYSELLIGRELEAARQRRRT